GEVFGTAFAIEGIFFFTEAIFIAIYIYGWKRMSGWAHFWTGVPVVIAGLGGAFSVVTVNSWMNQPDGFKIVNGQVTDVAPLDAIFNHATAYEVPHMILAAYLVTGFLVASVYAVGMLRGRRDRHHRLGLGIPRFDSFLVGFSTNTKVTGLDSVPRSDRPPANTMLHWAFDAMVGICSVLILL